MKQEHMGLFKAETSLSHLADERMETTSVCRSSEIILPTGEIKKVYNLSSNTYRNCVRRYGAYRLLELLELSEDDIPEISNVILFSGGPRLESSENVVPVKFIWDCCRYFPLLDLLGATVLFTMMSGRLAATQLNALTPDMANFKPEKKVMEAFVIDHETLPQKVVEFQFNTKRDPRTNFDDKQSGDRLNMPDELDQAYLKKHTECGVVANMFEVQMILKGTRMGHLVTLTSHSEKHLNMLGSCFASCLKKWAQEGGKIGGKISQGCGSVSWEYLPALPDVDEYESFVTKNKEIIAKLVMERNTWKDKNCISKLVG